MSAVVRGRGPGRRRARGIRSRGAGVIAAATAAALLTGCVQAPAPAPVGSPTPTGSADPITSAAIEHLDAAPCPPDAAPAFQVPDIDGILCGTLAVPLDHAAPAGEQLTLDVAIREGDAPRGALLLLGGGPGGAARWATAVLPLVMPEVAAEYQLVAVDPRGTGVDALECPAVQAEVGSSDIVSPSATAIEECAERLGDRARHQSTAAAIADLEILRERLGVDSWVLNGTSYGTFVAQQYALRHPEAVAALVLDSVVAASGVDPFLRSAMTAVPGVLEQVCAATGCDGDPVADLEAVLAAGEPALPLFNALVATSVMDPSFAGVLDALGAAAAGDATELDALVERAQAMATAEPLSGFSAGAHIATLCTDTPMPWGGATTPLRERATALESALAEVDAADTWPFPVSLAGEIATVDACLRWPVDAFVPPAAGPSPEIPVLLLSGALDLSTPVANAEAARATWPGAVAVVVPDAGHAAQLRPGGVAAVTEFLLGLEP